MQRNDMLARALDKAKISYLRVNNAFYRIGDWHKAQAPADRLGSRRWPRLLNHLATWVNPHLSILAKAGFGG